MPLWAKKQHENMPLRGVFGLTEVFVIVIMKVIKYLSIYVHLSAESAGVKGRS